MQKSKYYLLLLVLVLFGSFVFLESTAKDPLDWSYSYWKEHGKPFGAEIFHQIFTENLDQCQTLDKSPYKTLTEDYISGNYLFFNTGLYYGKYEANELLCWVESGNTLFMSAEYLSTQIMDTLGLKREEFVFNKQISYKPSVAIDTINDKGKFKFDRNLNAQYFKNTDTLDLEVLGYVSMTSKDSTQTKTLPNFVGAKFGRGQIYLHLFPQAFTNYFLVDSVNANYTSSILQKLDYKEDIFVDDYYKVQKAVKQQQLLQYLVGNKHLRWAYYLLLLTALIYVFFEGKRKQKPIKVVLPYENKTYAFTKTIAEMYYRKKDHKSIATKQIEHFYDYIRDQYNMKTAVFDDEFVKQLASKSGKQTKTIKALLKNIKRIESKNSLTKDELIYLEKQISNLKK